MRVHNTKMKVFYDSGYLFYLLDGLPCFCNFLINRFKKKCYNCHRDEILPRDFQRLFKEFKVWKYYVLAVLPDVNLIAK